MSLVDPKSGVGYAFGEKLPSGHVNTVWAQQPRALDATSGGAYTLGTALTWTINTLLTLNGTADIDFTGTGDLDIDKLAQLYNAEFDGQAVVNAGVNFEWLGTTNLPKIASREYILTQPLAAVYIEPLDVDTTPVWEFKPASGEYRQLTVTGAANYGLVIPITRIPNRSTLTRVRVVVKGSGDGGASHGSLPGTMPAATLLGRTLTGSTATTIGATVTDTPGSAANYDTNHVIATTYDLFDGSADIWTWEGLATAMTSNYHMWVAIVGEYGGGGATANALSVIGVECAFACTEIAPG